MIFLDENYINFREINFTKINFRDFTKKITCLKFFPPKIEQLETMITDENAMFDVLGDFFYHVNTKVRVAALEVSDFHVKNK